MNILEAVKPIDDPDKVAVCKHDWKNVNGKSVCTKCGWYRQSATEITKYPEGDQPTTESTDEDLDWIESYLMEEGDNELILEAGLKYEFRYIIGAHDGNLYKIVYNLNPNNLTDNEIYGLKRTIKKKGSGNYTSAGNKVLAIVNAMNNRRVRSVEGFPPIRNIGGIISPQKVRDVIARAGTEFGDTGLKYPTLTKKEIDKLHKDYPNKIMPADMWKKNMERSIAKGQKPITYTVGEIDPTNTFKTTYLGSPMRMFNLKESMESTDWGYDFDDFMEAKDDSNESYNVDMTPSKAKETLRTITGSILNTNKEDENKKVSQYTANIYSNVITKNLLPVWAKGFKRFKITLLEGKSFPIFQFNPPAMTQDFVSRFIVGRETLKGLTHRSNEIRVTMAPSIFRTMKEDDDAYNFFKAAIIYYDRQVEKCGNQLMKEILRLNHNMKHLIGNSKLRGLVTYPLSLLFSFSDVDMSDKTTFQLNVDDVKTINQFVRNISSRYAAPEKEKRQIIEDVKEMVKSLRECCVMDDTLKDLYYLPEEVEKLLFNGYDDMIEENQRRFVESQIDHTWKPEPKIQALLEGGMKKLKQLPRNIITYCAVEGEAIRDANDKLIILSYIDSKLEIVEWYLELLAVGSNKYLVPHDKRYLETFRTQLLALYTKIMKMPVPKADRPLLDIGYPKGYEG